MHLIPLVQIQAVQQGSQLLLVNFCIHQKVEIPLLRGRERMKEGGKD
jgi:hypothetical protein